MSAFRTLPAAALVLLALVGCTLAGCTLVAPGSVNAGSVDKGESPVSAIDQSAVTEALGAIPPFEDPTPARTADYNARFADEQWTAVVVNYPDAQRPDVEALDPVDDEEPINECRKAVTGDGVTAAVAQYSCYVRHPTVPRGVLSYDQAAYLYDYWTRFVLPCYADHGFAPVSDPPSRDDFATAWPFASWRPNPLRSGQPPTDPEHQLVESLCPSDLEWSR